MKIFKCKKLIVATSLIALFLAMAHQPLPARERRGAKVEVTLADGSQITGELLAVKSDALLVFDRSADQGKSIDLQQVVQVKIINKTKFGEGLLIGVSVAVGLCALYSLSNKHDSELGLYLYIVVPQAALFGGLIGALAGIDKKFSLDGASSYDDQQNLERLKRYAREQDLEKPTEPQHPVP